MNKSKCKGCGKPIIWIKTARGKSMPCDDELVMYWAKQKAAGKVVTPNGEVISCEFEGDISEVTGLGYISHYATCPSAGQFRRGK